MSRQLARNLALLRMLQQPQHCAIQPSLTEFSSRYPAALLPALLRGLQTVAQGAGVFPAPQRTMLQPFDLQRGMKKARELRPGYFIKNKAGELLEVVKMTYAQGQGRGSSLVHLELRSLAAGGAKVMERHPPDAALDDVQLDSKTATVLYTEGDLVHVMDSESYEQAAVSAGLFGDQKPFVVPDSEVTLRVWDGEVVRAQVAPHVTMKVRSLQPAAPKADGALLRPAFFDGSLRVLVPAHVAEGDDVVVRTEDCTFVRRAA